MCLVSNSGKSFQCDFFRYRKNNHNNPCKLSKNSLSLTETNLTPVKNVLENYFGET